MNVDGVRRYFDGQFPGNPGEELSELMFPTRELPLPMPEAEYELIAAYRTGRPLNYIQDLSGLAASDINMLNAVYPRGTQPYVRQSAELNYANIMLVGGYIDGLR